MPLHLFHSLLDIWPGGSVQEGFLRGLQPYVCAYLCCVLQITERDGSEAHKHCAELLMTGGAKRSFVRILAGVGWVTC